MGQIHPYQGAGHPVSKHFCYHYAAAVVVRAIKFFRVMIHDQVKNFRGRPPA